MKQHRLVCSSSTSGPVPLSLIPTCRRRGHALTDHADSNTLHLLCVGANRTWSSKKRLFCFVIFFLLLCMFPHSSAQAVRVCARVCVCVWTPPEAACAPLFQMTLFTDITQPPRIPRQNLISRERHSRAQPDVETERERFFFFWHEQVTNRRVL